MTNVVAGGSASATYLVTAEDTAAALGSGDLPVLGTPRLLAWCEHMTCAAIHDVLADDQTSVGTRLTLEHLKATPVGGTVAVTATVRQVDGRRVHFEVVALDESGALAGNGEVTRVIVDRMRFMARVT